MVSKEFLHKKLFLGCYYHGCDKCFKDPTALVRGNIPAGVKLKQTQDRMKKITEALNCEVIEVWECEIKEMLKNDAQMEEFFDDEENNAGPIVLSDAFFGGRTSATRLYAEATDTTNCCPTDYNPSILMSVLHFHYQSNILKFCVSITKM